MYYITHSTGATILGYLADGMEVAIKIMDSSVRNMTPGELDRLKGMDVTNCFLVKYKVPISLDFSLVYAIIPAYIYMK